jgi:transposase InsO family protein
MERLALDLAGPFPKSESGNRYLLVVQDYFSKWIFLIALPRMDAIIVANALFVHVVCNFGVPQSLHSDQGTQFESLVFQELCRLLGITKTRTSALHPQSDGMVERAIKTIVT